MKMTWAMEPRQVRLEEDGKVERMEKLRESERSIDLSVCTMSLESNCCITDWVVKFS